MTFFVEPPHAYLTLTFNYRVIAHSFHPSPRWVSFCCIVTLKNRHRCYTQGNTALTVVRIRCSDNAFKSTTNREASQFHLSSDRFFSSMRTKCFTFHAREKYFLPLLPLHPFNSRKIHRIENGESERWHRDCFTSLNDNLCYNDTSELTFSWGS